MFNRNYIARGDLYKSLSATTEVIVESDKGVVWFFHFMIYVLLIGN